MDRGPGVVSAAWNDFASEMGRWRDAGRTIDFWWRDDDATQPTSALERLLRLAGQFKVPTALAVIPARADPALFALLPPEAEVLQHGADHSNRAMPGEKKTEYPVNEAMDAALARLANGRRRLGELAGARSLGVLAPPWNRIAARLLPRLASCGFRGLSRYGARGSAQAAPGVTEINTHVDIIDWKGSRGFVGVEQALSQATRHLAARRQGGADADEPTGWLTHHACHDEQAWAFLADLFDCLRSEPGVRWKSARDLFAEQVAADP
ncbi:MAG TPA: polysaccharide deacetylase family protein [Burkholderiales bacterium]|nr:polysaccharide deacetylase family protein [Burkholderiales bacterium]